MARQFEFEPVQGYMYALPHFAYALVGTDTYVGNGRSCTFDTVSHLTGKVRFSIWNTVPTAVNVKWKVEIDGVDMYESGYISWNVAAGERDFQELKPGVVNRIWVKRQTAVATSVNTMMNWMRKVDDVMEIAVLGA